MSKAVARQKVPWCNRSVEWTAVAIGGETGPRTTIWSYRLGGLTYFGFPFEPGEESLVTRARALNWLNRHHLLVKREHRHHRD